MLRTQSTLASTQEFLKDLTETFINYSFEVTRKSPFFKGMNYNSKEMGFAFSSNTINYKEWLPGVKEAFLVGNFSEARYPLEETEDGFFQVVIHEEGQSKKMEGAKVKQETLRSASRLLTTTGTSSKFHLLLPGLFTTTRLQKSCMESARKTRL